MDDKINSVVKRAIKDRIFPGAVVGYATQKDRQVLPFGHLTYDEGVGKVTKDTIYDLASVTKVIPTNSIILSLIEKGQLSAEDQVIKFIPEVDNSYRDILLVKHLLTFTMLLNLPMGLKAHAAGGAQKILTTIYKTPLSFPPGQRYYYSNTPAILLGIIAERILQQPLDKIADAMFFKPLNMSNTTFHPEKLKQSLIAPTEINDRGEVRGKVHDETAWAMYKDGVISGHAGAFSIADDLLTFGQVLLNGGEYNGRRYFKPSTIAQISTEVIRDGKYGMSLGWEMSQPDYMSSSISPKVFGKDGFTGTMFLVDPDKRMCLVVLSNRTFPKRPENPSQINKIRRQLQEIVFKND